ncbi:MAG: hypothetical protein KatS3mg057_2328 [Herpetosiphonaceae bacterium]|nr:MAG: hypothetical protein KatS3mg057_2328 [Herpetosiphonaceae bacterium]
MRIIVDFGDPNNDLEVRGLQPGETPEGVLGPRGKPAWRLFGAAARLLFLVQQNIPAAADARDRELRFIQERLRELGGTKK